MPSARAATRSPLVLMADAHEWFSRALESVLVPGGYSVVKAYTATGLLQQLELTEPDALILAVDLPGGEGLNLCRMLRADSLVTPSTPIILTQPTPSTRRQTLAALRAGAAELWGQRLDAEELLLRLAAQNRAKADADRAWAEGLVDHATQLYNGRGIARRARCGGGPRPRARAPGALCRAPRVRGVRRGRGGGGGPFGGDGRPGAAGNRPHLGRAGTDRAPGIRGPGTRDERRGGAPAGGAPRRRPERPAATAYRPGGGIPGGLRRRPRRRGPEIRSWHAARARQRRPGRRRAPSGGRTDSALRK